jgi:hypothetical protein
MVWWPQCTLFKIRQGTEDQSDQARYNCLVYSIF